MPLDQVSNFVRGNTDESVSDTQTTISVVDASIFPDPTNGEYNVVIWDAGTHPRPDQDGDVEIMRVTGRDTTDDELTVDRGQEGTSGASHPDGAAIHLSPTAKLFGDIETELDGALQDGEDFDGQSTSDFTDLATVSVEQSITNEGGDYNESVETHASASGTVNVDLEDGNVHRVEAIDNITIEFNNVTTNPAGNSLSIYVVDDDGGGAYSISWPTEVVWSGDDPVDEVEQSGSVEIGLLTDDGGNEWRGRESGVNFA